MSRQTTQTITTNGGSTEPTTVNPNDKIEALAYLHWLDRGCPIGSPEEDWFQAENELKNRKGYAQKAA
jgi:hypothetical protein